MYIIWKYVYRKSEEILSFLMILDENPNFPNPINVKDSVSDGILPQWYCWSMSIEETIKRRPWSSSVDETPHGVIVTATA